MPKLTHRMNIIALILFSSLYQSKGHCEVKIIMLVWSCHQRLTPAKNSFVCFFLIYAMFLDICLLEELYLLFVSSIDLSYDIAVKEKARFVPLWGYDFDHRILHCNLLYFRGSNENKSQGNWEQQGGPFYSEVDYFIINPFPFLAPGAICTGTHPYAHNYFYSLFLLPSLRARSINLVSLIKAFKAQSYENILYISVSGMSLAVRSIYLPCHFVSLLKSLGTVTFGFLENFNKRQANNVFLDQAFPSLVLLRVSCRNDYTVSLPEFWWTLLLQHLSSSWQIALFLWPQTISGQGSKEEIVTHP